MTTDELRESVERGNLVAHKVWKWLQEKKRLTFVPWVLATRSESFDPVKVAVQRERDSLLTELQSLMEERATR